MSRESKKILSLLICVVMLLMLAPQFQLPVAALDIPAEYDIPITRPPETLETVTQGNCCENITWTLDSFGRLSIEGTGAMVDYASASDAPWYNHREAIKTVQISDGITTIGDRSFYNCSALDDVTIGADVTTVGTYAFRGCTALLSITLPKSVNQLKSSAFRACSNLVFVQIKGNAPDVETYVFSDGASSRTLQYPEGSTGFEVSPWTGFTQTTDHVGTWITAVAPTCTTEGSRYIDCSYCQDTFTEVIPATHRYMGGVCSVCWETATRAGGQCGTQVWWKLDVFGTLSLVGSGEMDNYDYEYYPTPWHPYCQDIQTVIVHSGITRIGHSGFSNCSNLTEITIPESVTSIGSSAFYGCNSLTDITIPESVTSIGNFAFSNCSSLTNITIPKRVTSIGNSAFYGCSNLTEITIPESVTSIGSSAFYGCSSLTDITIPESVTSIGSSAFYGCSSLTDITIPESVTSIGNFAFSNCSSLEDVYISDLSIWCQIDFDGIYSTPMYYAENLYLNNTRLTDVTIPESVTNVGNYTFYGCSSLTDITIPESVTGIGVGAFYGCSSLTSISVPESVTSIGDQAFSGCISLTSISIPDSVTSIGDAVFSGCISLTSVTIPESETSIGNSAFYRCSSLTSVTIPESVTSIGYDAFSGCSSLTNISIPESVTSIGSSAFYGCSSLTSVTILGNVTSIGDAVFSGCSSLTSVTIPESVTSIGDAVFSGCSSLTGMTIPESVTGIGFGAFYKCSSLTSVTIPESVTWIGESAFEYCSSLTSVKFMGSAPFFGWSCFSGVTADAYHSCTDATWTSAVKTNCSGTFTWNGHLFSDYVYNQDATCTQDGTMTSRCPECGEEQTNTVPNTALGHSLGSDGICDVCGDIPDIIINMTSAYDDGWGGAAIEVYADETLVTTATVPFGYSNQVTIPYALDTTYTFKWVSGGMGGECFEITMNGKVLVSGYSGDYSNGDTIYTLENTCVHKYETVTVLPTCTEAGSETTICTVCGKKTVVTLPAVGHIHVTEEQELTCTTDGYKTITCTTCGETSTEIFKTTGHSYEAEVTEPTCTQEGSAILTCQNCNNTYNFTIPVAEHHFADGSCTVCGVANPNHATPVAIPILTLKAPTLEFKDMITVNVFYTAENIEDVVEMGMITYTEQVTEWSVETAAHVISGTTYDVNTGCYIACSQGIHAKYLGDTVYLACYAKLTDGTYTYSKLASYSPLQYATNQLKNVNTDVKLKQLVAAMLNYGAAAQNYFGYNIDTLANASMTDDQKALPEGYTSSMVSTVPAADAAKQGIFANNHGFSQRKPAVSFEGAFSINYFFTPAYAPVDGITLYYWNEADFNAADVLTMDNATGTVDMEGSGTEQYCGDIEGIAAKALSEAVYVAAVYTNGGTTWTSGVLGYSIGAYCSSMAKGTGTMADLAMATAIYGYHAKQYFG